MSLQNICILKDFDEFNNVEYKKMYCDMIPAISIGRLFFIYGQDSDEFMNPKFLPALWLTHGQW